MPEDTDWKLYGPFSDKTLIREYLAHRLSASMPNYTPNMVFLELFLVTDQVLLSSAWDSLENLREGDVWPYYQGIYILEETIKVAPNRLNIHLASIDITGGYILSFDSLRNDSIPIEGIPDGHLVLHEPNNPTPDELQYITNLIDSLENILHSASYADPILGYNSLLDATSFMDQIILNEFTNKVDAYILSTYFYKDKQGVLKGGPLYDMSFTWVSISSNQVTR